MIYAKKIAQVNSVSYGAALFSILLLVMGYQISFDFGVVRLALVDILIFTFLVFAFAKGLNGEILRSIAHDGKYLRLLILFLIAISLSIFNSINVSSSLKDVLQALLYSVGSYIVLVNLIKSRNDLQVICRSIVILGVLLSLIGIAQWLGVIFAGFDIMDPIMVGNATPSSGSWFRVRASSLFYHFDSFSSFLLLPLFLSLTFAKLAKSRGYLLCAFIVISGIIVTWARGPILGALVGLLLFSLLLKEVRPILLLASLVIAAMGLHRVVTGPEREYLAQYFYLTGRFQAGTIKARLIDLNIAWRFFLEHPLIGMGWGTFCQQIFRLTGGTFRLGGMVKDGTPGSLPALFLSETGLIGTVAFATVLFYPLWKSLRAFNRIKKIGLDNVDCIILGGLLIALVSEITNGLVHGVNFFLRGTGLFYWATLHMNVIFARMVVGRSKGAGW
ncbi:TPA: hypothetical protein EYP70_02140 [Candidatus Bathyarchaeota archaeon]|nr:hypothetical protein [Candidatus Bathyarchaeota archaeon]